MLCKMEITMRSFLKWKNRMKLDPNNISFLKPKTKQFKNQFLVSFLDFWTLCYYIFTCLSIPKCKRQFPIDDFYDRASTLILLYTFLMYFYDWIFPKHLILVSLYYRKWKASFKTSEFPNLLISGRIHTTTRNYCSFEH